MFDADLPEMRRETTEEALIYIKGNRNVLERLRMAQEGIKGVRKRIRLVHYEAEKISRENNGDFGELFLAELDLVYWSKVVKELA